MKSAVFSEGFELIRQTLCRKNIFVVTDTNVMRLYSSLFSGVPSYALRAGEKNKNLAAIERIIAEMIRSGCDRKTTLIAIGGGVTGDTAGFAAACFYRGISWINIPTTLLAMVDSGIGGKTGVDVDGFKNVAGAFHYPEEVIIDAGFLKTLPEREWLCGVGEMVKHALLSREILDATVMRLGALLSRADKTVDELIKMSVNYKEGIVREDFKECGLRKQLNVGHTVGHALEKVDGFRLSHGEYVALGLRAELGMFKERLDAVYYETAIAMARRVCGKFPNVSTESIAEAARSDKKNGGGRIVIMLPTGDGALELAVDKKEFIERLNRCLSEA